MSLRPRNAPLSCVLALFLRTPSRHKGSFTLPKSYGPKKTRIRSRSCSALNLLYLSRITDDRPSALAPTACVEEAESSGVQEPQSSCKPSCSGTTRLRLRIVAYAPPPKEWPATTFSFLVQVTKVSICGHPRRTNSRNAGVGIPYFTIPNRDLPAPLSTPDTTVVLTVPVGCGFEL